MSRDHPESLEEKWLVCATPATTSQTFRDSDPLHHGVIARPVTNDGEPHPRTRPGRLGSATGL